MENKNKPNIKLLILVGFIVLINILVIVAAILGNGGLTITLMGFNIVFLIAVYFVVLANRNQSIDDEDDSVKKE